MGDQRKTDTSLVGWARIHMKNSPMDVITLCDYEMCPTIKSDDKASALIVVKSDGESQLFDSRIGHRVEPVENRAIGDAHF